MVARWPVTSGPQGEAPANSLWLDSLWLWLDRVTCPRETLNPAAQLPCHPLSVWNIPGGGVSHPDIQVKRLQARYLDPRGVGQRVANTEG